MTGNTSLDLDHFLPFRLAITSNLVSEGIASAYQALFGLRIAEWRIIAVAAESDAGVTQQEIGARTLMDKVTVSRATRALEARGLIARRMNARDGRSQLLALAPPGRLLFRQVAPKALALEQAMLADLSADERAQLTHLLERVGKTALRLRKTSHMPLPATGGAVEHQSY